MKKRFSITSTALAVSALSFLAVGCSSSTNNTATAGGSSNGTSSTPQKVSSVLNVGNFGAYLPHVILRQFEKKYHTQINYTTYPSNSELLAKMQAGDQFDVAVASDYMVQTMTRLGLLDKIDFTNVPNIKNIDPALRHLQFDPSGSYSVPYLWGAVAIAVNTHKVHTKVTSYTDLLTPAFKNSLVSVDSPRSVIGIALMMNGHNINDTNAKDLAQAQQTLMKFRPQIKVFDSDQPHVELLNGEATAGFVWTGEGAQAYSQDPWIVPVYPKAGVNTWVDNMIVPAGTPHKYTAELFINFLLQPKISAELENDQEYTDPNMAATPYIDKALLKNPWITLPSYVVKHGEVEVGLTAAGNAAFNKIWTDFKQSSGS